MDGLDVILVAFFAIHTVALLSLNKRVDKLERGEPKIPNEEIPEHGD